MNGMRKVGRSKALKAESNLSDEELDFGQGIEDALEDTPVEELRDATSEIRIITELKEDNSNSGLNIIPILNQS